MRKHLEQSPQFQWQRIRDSALPSGNRNSLIEARLEEVLSSWLDTPYVPGQFVKGVGVDCIRFVAGVLNELFGEELLIPPRLPQDTALHNAEGANKVLETFQRAYPNEEVTNKILEPADVIVIGPYHGGPGHALIAGFRKNTLWHAINGTGSRNAIRQTGIGELSRLHQKVFRIFRLLNKEEWVNNGS